MSACCSPIEHDRLDTQASCIVEMIGGKPFLGIRQPLVAGSKAVDLGCGTGVATMQLASMFTAAQVYGVDLSPVPEASRRVTPDNATFVTGNVLAMEENYALQDVLAPRSVNYLFGRMLFLGINDWRTYFGTAAASLRPGAILEHQDLDWRFYRAGSSTCLSDDWPWWHAVVAAARATGLSAEAGTGAAGHMRAAGLDVVAVQTFEFSFVPSAETPASQAMGRYVQAKLMPQYPELLARLLRGRIAEETLREYTEACLRDLASEEGLHQKYTVTIGRKPADC